MAKGVNISQGGVLLETRESLEVGQEVDLAFSLPQIADALCVKVRVVRTEMADRIALQFAELDLESSEAIAAYLAGLMPE